MTNLQLKSVHKSFGAVDVIKGVDLEIEHGEFVVFVGPSGCGKSTLLRMIAGLEDISAGELWIGDRLSNDIEPRDRGIAMVFQSYALYPHMSVYDNMGFGLKLAKTPQAERDAKVREAARILQMEPLLDRKPSQLSGGQRQRVAIGRAIVRNPDVFLFDEPLSNLDAALRVDMRMELSRLHHELGATMVYVTHDQVEAMTLADRIVVLNGGIVQQVGTPIELYNGPANLFVAGFIGSPRMNFTSVRVTGTSDGQVSIAGEAIAPTTVSVQSPSALQVGDKLTLGVRPHDLLPATEGLFSGRVNVVERLGNETIVSFDLPTGDTWLAVLDGDKPIPIGTAIALHASQDRTLLFDAAGQALVR